MASIMAAVRAVLDLEKSMPSLARSNTWKPLLNVPDPTCLMALYVAVSTRFSIEVRMYGLWSELAVRYWSESTPIAHFFFSAAAWKRPAPDRPEAW